MKISKTIRRKGIVNPPMPKGMGMGTPIKMGGGIIKKPKMPKMPKPYGSFPPGHVY